MERCLDNMEISTVADFIMKVEWVKPKPEWIDHVIECQHCQMEVVELVEICSDCDEDDD